MIKFCLKTFDECISWEAKLVVSRTAQIHSYMSAQQQQITLTVNHDPSVCNAVKYAM